MEIGPDPAIDGAVRWRRVDLQRVIERRFDVVHHERYVGKLLKQLGVSHVSACRRHPAEDDEIVEAYKKNFPRTPSTHLADLPKGKPKKGAMAGGGERTPNAS